METEELDKIEFVNQDDKIQQEKTVTKNYKSMKSKVVLLSNHSDYEDKDW